MPEAVLVVAAAAQEEEVGFVREEFCEGGEGQRCFEGGCAAFCCCCCCCYTVGVIGMGGDELVE